MVAEAQGQLSVEASNQILARLAALEFRLHKFELAAPPKLSEEFRARFCRLADEWVNESPSGSSLLRNRFMHPAYQQVIGMGPDAVPLILAELAEEPDHWGWALAAITGENPVKPEDAGDIEAIARAWLRWGLAKGLKFGNEEKEEPKQLSPKLAEPHANKPRGHKQGHSTI